MLYYSMDKYFAFELKKNNSAYKFPLSNCTIFTLHLKLIIYRTYWLKKESKAITSKKNNRFFRNLCSLKQSIDIGNSLIK